MLRFALYPAKRGTVKGFAHGDNKRTLGHCDTADEG
jgi:hypothetical protein